MDPVGRSYTLNKLDASSNGIHALRRLFFQTRTSFDPGLKVRNHGFDVAVTGVVPEELTVVMTSSLANDAVLAVVVTRKEKQSRCST